MNYAKKLSQSGRNKIAQPIKITKASLSDLHELQQIGVASYLPHYTYLWKTGGVDWYLERCFGDETLAAQLSDDNIEYYFVQANEQNIGFMKLVLLKPVPDSDVENALYLEKIYFIKEWTGKGAGRELIELALKRAQELNRDCVWLTAMDTSAKPIEAYEKSGFTIHAKTRLDFELMKKEFRGIVVMSICLSISENKLV